MTRQYRQNDFENLLRPYAAACYKSAFRLTGSQADAEDLVQELFVKLYQQLDVWRDQENPLPWMRRVLYNLHIDAYRKRARTHGINETTREQGDEVLDRLENPDLSPLAAAEQSQQQAHLLAALDQLDADERALVAMHLMEGHTLNDLATQLDTPLGTLKARLHRTKAKLKKYLKLQPFSEN
jgi:RNA polymerase sigma-70 factor (ECF subfamily)